MAGAAERQKSALLSFRPAVLVNWLLAFLAAVGRELTSLVAVSASVVARALQLGGTAGGLRRVVASGRAVPSRTRHHPPRRRDALARTARRRKGPP